MGWNQGWTMLQEQVIELYNVMGAEAFAPIADIFLAPYRYSVCDEGGKSYDYVTDDGKQMEQVMVEALWPDFSPDMVPPGDFEGEEDDMYSDKEWAYIKVFYSMLNSENWRNKWDKT